ncbi:UNVERIFIED_ORG: hypothetical protein QOE_3925 [Clostridioides difficile F501]
MGRKAATRPLCARTDQPSRSALAQNDRYARFCELVSRYSLRFTR